MEKLSKPATVPVVDNLIDMKEPAADVLKKDEERGSSGEEDETMFDNVLQSIPLSLRDDGVFGLNLHNHRIGSHQFRVINDDLVVEGVKTYHIRSEDLWRLLLLKRPSSIDLKLKSAGKYKSFVRDYKRIVDELNLVDYAYAKCGNRMKNRAKYKLLQDLAKKHGSGFLFSVKPPPFKPSTVVIPSDKKGLLRALYKAVAELRAGNTSMQNLVVPLAQEAKRKKILPPRLLTKEEKHWVFS